MNYAFLPGIELLLHLALSPSLARLMTLSFTFSLTGREEDFLVGIMELDCPSSPKISLIVDVSPSQSRNLDCYTQPQTIP